MSSVRGDMLTWQSALFFRPSVEVVGHPLLQEGQVTQISETYVQHEFRHRNISVPESQDVEFRVGAGETVPLTTDND